MPEVEFFVGTRAEVVKITPVVKRLFDKGLRLNLIWVGLHKKNSTEDIEHLFSDKLWINRNENDISRIPSVIYWFLRTLIKSQLRAAKYRRQKMKKRIVIVQGDTLCTLIGSLYGFTSGNIIAHIEAGARSGKLLRPFPEEIIRRFVSRVANIHFAPGDREFEIVQKYRGEKINTTHNTSRDALYDKLVNFELEDLGYVVVTLHRTELLTNSRKMKEACEAITEISHSKPVRWFVGEHELSIIKKANLFETINGGNITIIPRLVHEDFIRVIAGASFVITDSGGLQSECQDLGIPVAVHRRETEYLEWGSSPIVLTNCEGPRLISFFKEIHEMRSVRGKLFPSVASDVIRDVILEKCKVQLGHD